MLVALVAALFGFTGLLQTTAVFAQALFFILTAFAALSLVFSLFEPVAGPRPRAIPLSARRSQP